MIYFDWNSTTPLLDIVIEQMHRAIACNEPWNPSAMHTYGRLSRSILDEARRDILLTLGDVNDQYELIFTSSGTEANNQIIDTFFNKQIYVSNIEHSSILSKSNSSTTLIPCNNDCLIEADNLSKILEQNVIQKGFLTSIMHSNNETGVIQDIEQLTNIVHDMNGFMHSDLSQSLSKVPIDLSKLNVDYATISSHKIGGPIGIAALIYRKNLPIKAMLHGGKQEHGLRAGTENIIAINGFASAIKVMHSIMQHTCHIENLRNIIENEIDTGFGSSILSHCYNRLPNTTMITMYNVNNMSQVVFFDINGIAVSHGSACNTGKVSQSHVLTAMRIAPEIISQTIRISLGYTNTLEEVYYFLQKWHEMARANK